MLSVPVKLLSALSTPSTFKVRTLLSVSVVALNVPSMSYLPTLMAVALATVAVAVCWMSPGPV
jgi:hypothetical protein